MFVGEHAHPMSGNVSAANGGYVETAGLLQPFGCMHVQEGGRIGNGKERCFKASLMQNAGKDEAPGMLLLRSRTFTLNMPGRGRTY